MNNNDTVVNSIKPNRPPDYIGVGFRRCASSWLHQCLFEHPDIGHYRGKTAWGMHFFSREENYCKGLDYYERELQPLANKKVIGELSDSYTYPEVHTQVAERIIKNYPGIKLFCMVRNPADRAYSDYLRSVGIGRLDPSVSFEKAIEMDARYIERGFYGKILEKYISYLHDNRLLVLFNEDLKSEPENLVKRLYNYLGVSESFLPSVLTKRINQGKMIKSKIFHNLISNSQRVISYGFRKIGCGFMLEGIKALGIQDMVLKLNRKETSTIASNTRTMLAEIYQEDMEKLADLLHQDLSFWRT